MGPPNPLAGTAPTQGSKGEPLPAAGGSGRLLAWDYMAPISALSAPLFHLILLIRPPVTRISCCLVAKSCSTLCDLMDCSTSGFPVLHYLPEFVQIHVHCISNAV